MKTLILLLAGGVLIASGAAQAGTAAGKKPVVTKKVAVAPTRKGTALPKTRAVRSTATSRQR